MSVDLSDPNILVGYRSIVVEESMNWLLLSYEGSKFDRLALITKGSQGIEELKNKLRDAEDVFIVFCKEETSNGDSCFTLVNYIPEEISGVRKARALVHSRRVGALFQETEPATLTIDRLENLTLDAIYQAHSQPDKNFAIPTTQAKSRAVSQIISTTQINSDSQVQRSVSEPVSPQPQHMKSGMISSFMRWKKRQGSPFEDAPPIPPKDRPSLSVDGHARNTSNAITLASKANATTPQDYPRRVRTNSLSEFAVISLEDSMSSDEGVLDIQAPPKSPLVREPLPRSARRSVMISSAGQSKQKWSVESDPMLRARRRVEAQRRRKMEEEELMREEAERQVRMKAEKENRLKEEQWEEERRRALLEEELKLATLERRRKERDAQEAEERKKKEIDEKKRLDREKRIEEGRRSEEWRKETARRAFEAAREVERLKRKEEEERRARIKLVQAKVKKNVTGNGESGWVTLQTNESLLWKRRFFKIVGSTALFYRSPQDMNLALDKVELQGRVKALREWNEGFEELGAIPHSFAIEFKDGQGSWSMYTDSEEEKYELLGLLHHAAGL